MHANEEPVGNVWATEDNIPTGWTPEGTTDGAADAIADQIDCSPTKVCRNARDFTFDGIGDEDEDLATSWRRLLKQEGKFSESAPSVRELVLGTADRPTE
ncbi:MAG: hypothetical protein AAF531_03210 [Actinomycetota bacterium]